MRILGRVEVARNLPGLEEAVDLAAAIYSQGPAEGLEIPPKVAVHPREESFMHAMPCYMGGSDLLGLKWIGGFEHNRARGLPYISGILVLNDPETGFPAAIMDAGPITISRTVAASGVWLRAWMGGGAPASFGIVGCGVQGVAHARALAELAPRARGVAFDPDPSRARSLCPSAEAVASPEQAIAASEVVVTAAPMRGPGRSAGFGPDLLDSDRWLALPLDMDASLGPEVAAAADLFAVDNLAQYEHYRAAGYFAGWRAPDCSVADLHSGHAEIGGRTLAVSLGIASLDLGFGARVLAAAASRGEGIELDLLAGPVS